MKKIDVVFEIEELTKEMSIINSLAKCNESAIIAGVYDSNDFLDSFCLLARMTNELYGRIYKLQESLFCEVKSNETN